MIGYRDIIKIKQLINSVDSANINLGLLLAKNSGNRNLWEYARNFEIKKLHEYFGTYIYRKSKRYNQINFFYNDWLIRKENIVNLPKNVTLSFEYLNYKDGINALIDTDDDFVEIVDTKFYDNGKVTAISQNDIEFSVLHTYHYNITRGIQSVSMDIVSLKPLSGSRYKPII